MGRDAAGGQFLRGDAFRRQFLRCDGQGRDLIGCDGAGPDLLRADGVRGDFVRRDGLRLDQLRADRAAGDLVGGDAVGCQLPGGDAARPQRVSADAPGGQRPPAHRVALQVIAGYRAAGLLLAERTLDVPIQQRVPCIARQLDGGRDVQRPVLDQNPVSRRRVLQRRVFLVFFRIRQMDPVHFQRDVGPVAFVDGKAVVRRRPHPLVDHVLRQLDLRAVRLLFLLADFQLRVQRLRPVEGDVQNRVNMLFRQQDPAPVFRLGDGPHLGHDLRDAPVPFHVFLVVAVIDGVGRRRFRFDDQEVVQIVPDQHAAGGCEDAVLRIHDSALRVLPAPVPADVFLPDVGIQPARVILLHRPAQEHESRGRVRPRHVAVAQEHPPQLIADMLRVQIDGFPVLDLFNFRDNEALFRDLLRRVILRFAAALAGDLALLDEAGCPRQRRRFHVFAVEVAGLHDHVAGVQRLRDLAAAGGASGDMVPSVGQRVRRGHRVRVHDVVKRLVVVPIIGNLRARRVLMPVDPRRIGNRVRNRHGDVQRHVAFPAAHFVIVELAQLDSLDRLLRNRAPQHLAVFKRKRRALRADRDIQIIPPGVLEGDLGLQRLKRQSPLAEVRCPLAVELNHVVSHPYKNLHLDLMISLLMFPVYSTVFMPLAKTGKSPLQTPSWGTPFLSVTHSASLSMYHLSTQLSIVSVFPPHVTVISPLPRIWIKGFATTSPGFSKASPPLSSISMSGSSTRVSFSGLQ